MVKSEGSLTERDVNKINNPDVKLTTISASKIKPGRGIINIARIPMTPTPRITSD
jgi:hypothetical protein